MNLNDHMKWWSHASVKIMDTRSGRLEAGFEIAHYRLPSSAFLYAVQGQAVVELDELRVTLGRNQLAHGGGELYLPCGRRRLLNTSLCSIKPC